MPNLPGPSAETIAAVAAVRDQPVPPPRVVIRCSSGRMRRLPSNLDPSRVVGLDSEGRIVVDDFGALDQPIPPTEDYTFRDAPFLFGLTLCCNASDKGCEDGVFCRGCYGSKPDADAGNYLYRMADGTFLGLDPIVTD